MEVEEGELQALYNWVDDIPLSRLKRSINRDFADGVLVAEIVHHYHPRLVELHNYSAANSTLSKMCNWSLLNKRVFRRLGFVLTKAESEAVCTCQPGAIERVLKLVQVKLAEYAQRHPEGSSLTAEDSMLTSRQQASTPTPREKRPAKAASPAALGVTANAAGTAATPAQPAQAGQGAQLEASLAQLQASNEELQRKVAKLEQLLQLKDAKVQSLLARLQINPQL